MSGAASGMGEATAHLFAREGASVALADVQCEKGRRIAGEIQAAGGAALFIECDVTCEEAVRTSIEQAVEAFGGLQIVVSCAGIVQVQLLHEASQDEWDHLMAVNVRS